MWWAAVIEPDDTRAEVSTSTCKGEHSKSHTGQICHNHKSQLGVVD